MRLLAVAVVASLLPAIPAQAQASTTYYVDSRKGDDSAAGTSPAKAWKTLGKVNAATLRPGDAVSLKRGSQWTGRLTLAAKGTASRPILLQPYGNGPVARISGRDGNCVVVSGDHWRITGVRASGCQWAGFEISGDRNQLVGVLADRNIAGVLVTPAGSRNVIRDSVLTGNDRMSVNDSEPDNDSGAFGVLLNGDDNTVTGNTIAGSYAPSADYGFDGAAVEVFDGDRNLITHNTARDNETFTELGARKGGTATGNVFAFNVVTSSRGHASFLITRGPQHVVGPVIGTLAVHNSVYLPARRTIGWSCHGGCSPSILRLRNNVISVGGEVGYEDGKGADDAGGVYEGRTYRFKLGRGSVKADPRFVSRTDLHLRPGSPALGHGVRLGPEWFGGVSAGPGARPPSPDAGAYQR
jgi:hypothetical protein